MPTYIMLVNFTDQGRKGVKEVPNRQEKTREVAKQLGVHLYDAPNDEAMAKFVMTLASFGNIRTTVMRAWDEFRASSAYTGVAMTMWFALLMSASGPKRTRRFARKCVRLTQSGLRGRRYIIPTSTDTR
jgi:uncharacterized protein with GYD domain